MAAARLRASLQARAAGSLGGEDPETREQQAAQCPRGRGTASAGAYPCF